MTVGGFAVADCGDRVLQRFDGVEALHEVGAVREDREPRKDVQMLLVIRRADEEEVPRRLAVRRTEKDRTKAAAVRDEAFLEEIGVVKTRMQQRHALADRR